MLKTKMFSLLCFLFATSLMTACAHQPGDFGREPANIGGYNYNVGTYDCVDDQNGLKSHFTFGESTASFTINNKPPVDLNCGPFREGDMQDLQYFKKYAAKQYADLCVGQSTLGRVLAGTSNSMGAVQMTAILISNGAIKADSVINCRGAAQKGGGWQ